MYCTGIAIKSGLRNWHTSKIVFCAGSPVGGVCNHPKTTKKHFWTTFTIALGTASETCFTKLLTPVIKEIPDVVETLS